MGTRSTNTDAGVDSKQKQTHTHIHARAQICMKDAFKLQARKGEFQVLDSKQKIVTFNEFYYIAFTPTLTQKQTPKSLVKTMARVFFKRRSWLT